MDEVKVLTTMELDRLERLAEHPVVVGGCDISTELVRACEEIRKRRAADVVPVEIVPGSGMPVKMIHGRMDTLGVQGPPWGVSIKAIDSGTEEALLEFARQVVVDYRLRGYGRSPNGCGRQDCPRHFHAPDSFYARYGERCAYPRLKAAVLRVLREE